MEEWKKVEGLENYSVSCLGNVRNDLTGRILKPFLAKGYHALKLWNNKIRYHREIHRLVATSFCENENGYNIVDHKDQHKTNNHYLNLRWVTHGQNMRNQKKKDGGSSRYIGVSYNTRLKKWVAQIKINKKLNYLGRFKTQEEARDAFRKAVADNNLQDFYPPDAEESL